MRALPLLTLGILLWPLGCGNSPDKSASREAKLKSIMHEIAQRASPENQAAFAKAIPFTSIQDMDVAVIGFRIPIGDGKRHVLVSFTCDHFDVTSVQQLVTEAIADYFRATKANPVGG